MKKPVSPEDGINAGPSSGRAGGLLLVAAIAAALPLLTVGGVVESSGRPAVFRDGKGGYLYDEAGGSKKSEIGGWRGLLLGEYLDVNSASAKDLEALPGIGEKTAAAILSARAELKGFSSVEELKAVKGLGGARLARLKEWIRAGD